VTGPAGTLVLTGAQLRSRLGLKSTMVRFEVLAPQLAALPVLPPLMPRAADQSGLAEPAITPDQVPVQLPPPSLLAIGRGFGHGVGMSQWGAHGMANRGQSYEQILHHYYRGTELRPYVSP
jgi:stage II sporulation protein D